MLLVIDPAAVPAEIRIENCEGEDERYPNIYGALPSAVIRADPVPPREDGTLDLDREPRQYAQPLPSEERPRVTCYVATWRRGAVPQMP